jgi:hypothetical protein
MAKLLFGLSFAHCALFHAYTYFFAYFLAYVSSILLFLPRLSFSSQTGVDLCFRERHSVIMMLTDPLSGLLTLCGFVILETMQTFYLYLHTTLRMPPTHNTVSISERHSRPDRSLHTTNPDTLLSAVNVLLRA